MRIQVSHNHIRPQMSLDRKMPGAAAGIKIEGDDEGLAII
jgi:hypothetical protein